MFDCIEQCTSTQRAHYGPIPPGNFPPKAPAIKQADELVLSGHFKNNLLVNGVQIKSRVWPKSQMNIEEYQEFVDRLEKCDKEIFKLYFRKPNIDVDVIERMLRDLEKTAYQFSYSPNEYVPRKEARRFLRSSKFKSNLQYYATTYGTYYNRMAELHNFMEMMRGHIVRGDKEELKNELKKIYKLGTTTYHVCYCVPTIEENKGKTNLKVGPIDRYTLRRV